MEEVKLIGAIRSRHCFRIERALKLKGIEYEYIVEDLSNKSPTLLKYNPVYKKVPVLVHNDKAIWESLIILEYIDQVWKQNPLLSQDPHERAIARCWAKFCDEKIVGEAWEACKCQGEEKKEAIESLQESLAVIERKLHLQGKKFFNGENIGYLDLVFGWIPILLDVMEELEQVKLFDGKKLPLLYKWSRNFLQISLIKECIPARETLAIYICGRINGLRSLQLN